MNWKTSNIIAVLIVLHLTSRAHADGPIAKHLKDATKLNRKRALPYAKLTNNKSFALSYELITIENLGLVITNRLDMKAKLYNDHGIGIFHDELVDMKYTPDFSPVFLKDGPPKIRVITRTEDLIRKWLKKIKLNQLDEIYHESVDLLDHGILKETNQNCLTRHLVESIAKSIHNHEGHRERASKLGLPDPHELLLSYLKIQIRSLSWAESLDERAYPIQKSNVPLFCRDVPPILYK